MRDANCVKCRKPLREKRWKCEKCGILLCPSCVTGFCIFCKGGMKELAEKS